MANKAGPKFKKGDPWVNIPDKEPKPKYKCFKGSTFGPASPCISFNQEESEYWRKENPRLAYKKTWRSRKADAK
jgi:hypothetical protein